MNHFIVLLCICTCVSVVCSFPDELISSRNVNCSAYCSLEICSVKCPNKTKVIHIQGFIPFDNNVFAVESLIPAVWVATEDVNGDCSILPDYFLQIDIVNTECDPSVSSYHAMESAEQDDHKILAYLGGGCSLATEPLATIAGNVYKIPTVSYGASSPSLSNNEMFPNFYRTIPSEIQANSARFALINKHNWTKIATLYETVSLFSLAAKDFDCQYTNIYGKIDAHLVLSFSQSPAVALQRIRDEDFRIIMGYFYEDKAIATLCLAYHLKLTTANHVWILPAWYQRDWFDTDYNSGTTETDKKCTKEQMREAVKYTLFLDSYNESNTTTDTGNTYNTKEFVKKLDCYLEEFKNNPLTGDIFTERTEAHIYSGFTYDAVWMIAYALDRTEHELVQSRSGSTIVDFEYFEVNNVSKIIARYLAATNFSGVSGPVVLDENGTRSGLTGIYQLRENPNNKSQLMQMLIAVHHPGLRGKDGLFNYDFSYLPGLQPKWKGGTKNAPSDRSNPLSMHLKAILVYSAYTFASVTFAVALSVLIFNLTTLWKPLIKHSAPHINTIIVIGCGVMLVGSVLLGIDSKSPETHAGPMDMYFKIICTLRLWVLTLGFTLSFGALFAKTCQLYSIYTNKELINKPFKMRRFFLIMVIFFTIDVAYLSFWTGIYPFRRMWITVDESDQDQTIQLEYEICHCDKFEFLIGALFIYKGIVVTCGLFLAYESRNVKYFYINDSRFVSITMYIVVILVGIGAPLSLVLAVHNFVDAAYGLATFTIITACMSCLLILFIPKVFEMLNPTSAEKSLEKPAVALSELKTNMNIDMELEVINVPSCQPKELLASDEMTDGTEGISTETHGLNGDTMIEESCSDHHNIPTDICTSGSLESAQ